MRKKRYNPYKYLVLLVSILFVAMVTAVSFTDLYNYDSPLVTSNSSIMLGWNISAPDGISNINFSWDGTNYSIYDSSLVLFYNFNNFSALGENDTHVKDLSKYGNNGTIVGWDSDPALSNITWTPNCHSGGCFNFSGGVNSININSENVNNILNNLTISFWIYKKSTAQQVIFYKGNVTKTPILIETETDSALKVQFANSSTNFISQFPTTLSLDNWTHIVITYNGVSMTTYKNGVNVFSYDSIGNIQNIVNHVEGIGSLNSASRFFNGSIDDIMIFNRSLSTSEISQLYKTDCTKYNQTDWGCNFNQSLNAVLNSSVTSYNFPYQICVSNSSSSENCTSQKVITQTIPNKNVVANFSNQVGNIRSDFYGIGLQSSKLVSGSIDTNCDGTADAPRNLTWQQDTFKNSGAKITYYDVGLGTYYNGIRNSGFEDWYNSTLANVSVTEERAYGWSNNPYSGSTMWVSQSTDSHSGTYSMNITGITGTNNYFTSYSGGNNYLNFMLGNNYTFSIWVKGSGQFRFNMQEAGGSYSSCDSTYFTTSSSWVQYNITCNNLQNKTSTVYSNYRMSIDEINSTEWFLFDDFAVYENGVNKSWWRTGNMTNFQNQLTLDYQNNITSILIMDYMPSFLANRTMNSSGWSNCVDNITSSDVNDCMFSNEIVWNEIVLDAYKTLDQYRNRTWWYSWNEPDGGFFEDNLASASAKTDFVILQNTTYNTFYNYNSNIIFAGYRGLSSSTTTTSISAFTQMMLSNLSSQFKKFSYHPYDTKYIGYSSVSSEIDYLLTQCAVYGAECSHILLDEWQPTSQTLKNQSNGQSNEYKSNIAYFLQDLMNGNKSSIVSEMPYHWDDSNSYFNCPSRYGEYPSFWSAVSEAGLDNPTATYYPPYNVTKNFATRHRAGDNVVFSNSTDNDGVKIVSSKSLDNLQHAITVINTNNYSVNETLTIYGDTITSFKDQNNNVYPVTAGVLNLGVIDSYGISYLTEDLQPPTLTIDSPTSSTYSTTTIYFNITLDEEGDTCVYSLNNFLTNYSMAKQGWVNEFKASRVLASSNNNYTVKFWCNDTSGNVNNSMSISFKVDTSNINYDFDQDLEPYCIPILQSLADIPTWFGIIIVIVFCIVLIGLVLGIIKLVNDEIITFESIDGLGLALSVITFLFIIGLLVFLYALMIGGLCG